MLKLSVIFLCFVLSACATITPVVKKTKEPPVVPDVICENGKIYLVYEEDKIMVEIGGVLCVMKKGKLT